MRIERLDGRSPVLGPVGLRLPGGLVALVARDGRVGAALVRLVHRGLLGSAAPTGSPGTPGGAAGGDGEETTRLVLRGRGREEGGDPDLATLRVGSPEAEEPGEVL
ncbi:MAG TPA: hypothetical protein VE173_01245, partial [Longimicrobiales bacterium]|nr:hypothetical protein [Longimicrobiales bacterium]